MVDPQCQNFNLSKVVSMNRLTPDSLLKNLVLKSRQIRGSIRYTYTYINIYNYLKLPPHDTQTGQLNKHGLKE